MAAMYEIVDGQVVLCEQGKAYAEKVFGLLATAAGENWFVLPEAQLSQVLESISTEGGWDLKPEFWKKGGVWGFTISKGDVHLKFLTQNVERRSDYGQRAKAGAHILTMQLQKPSVKPVWLGYVEEGTFKSYPARPQK